jgi:hypothetical protein
MLILSSTIACFMYERCFEMVEQHAEAAKHDPSFLRRQITSLVSLLTIQLFESFVPGIANLKLRFPPARE